jgi:epoxyqueuosine reductase
VLVDDNALHDREAAYRAGLGWYGKNANLLLPGAGSWFVLGSVVTDAPLARDGAGRSGSGAEPGGRVADGCGTCTRCITACPTGAIVSPGVVDARRCLAWLLQVEGPFPLEHRVALGGRIYGCDDCQEVCPPNRLSERRDPAAPLAGPAAEPTVDLLAMLAATDDELLAAHGRWYVPRRQARYLRRNALVALANVAAPGAPPGAAGVGVDGGRAVEGGGTAGAAGAGDDVVRRALRRSLADDDALVRGHAVWAARRLGHDDLLAGLADERDPSVRSELDGPVPVRRPDASPPPG